MLTRLMSEKTACGACRSSASPCPSCPSSPRPKLSTMLPAGVPAHAHGRGGVLGRTPECRRQGGGSMATAASALRPAQAVQQAAAVAAAAAASVQGRTGRDRLPDVCTHASGQGSARRRPPGRPPRPPRPTSCCASPTPPGAAPINCDALQAPMKVARAACAAPGCSTRRWAAARVPGRREGLLSRSRESGAS